MGKRILVQRRGRGAPPYRAPTHRRLSPSAYPPLNAEMQSGSVTGVVKAILHESGRGAPLAQIRLEDGSDYYTVATEGIAEGSEVKLGAAAPVAVGNVLPLGVMTEGTVICNVERSPGDGGKLIRSSGTYGTVSTHTAKGTTVRLPSGGIVTLSDRCRATVGVVAGGGRTDKPFLKAGTRLHLMRARGRKYPRVRGVAMTSVFHPHGGGRHQHPGKPTSVSRTTPPGRKVGLIAAKQTGRGGKARKRETRGS
ncbi:MAG: 50S ribosomal protein L2 [Candidatus Bathyarchaeia archaeon]